MKTHFFVLPTYLASALINNDWTGLNNSEIKECKQWLMNIQPGTATAMDEPYFSKNNDMNNLAGEVAEFTFIY